MTGPDRMVLYFGCLDEEGHYLHLPRGRRQCDTYGVPDFPWSIAHLDTGLLKNGKHRDVYDGKVFWTCGGRPDFWFAFFWWDRSVDQRGASNSGLYVRGFRPEVLTKASAAEAAIEAFEFGKAAHPAVVKRQRFPLVLQP